MEAMVIGGSRFIGLHLVRLLSEQGHGVTVLNRGQTEAELPANVERLTADRTDPDQVRDALVNRSWDVAFDTSGYTPETLDPVVRALEGKVGRFVFCSTTSVYAESDIAPVEEDFPLDRNPDASEYARNKILCEDLLDKFEGRGFPMTILRPPYVYGPDNYLAQREFSYFARLARSRRIIVPGAGQALLHSVHVDDLVDAFIASPQTDQTMGRTYTICGPDAITVDGWVAAIGEAMGVAPEIVHSTPKQYAALEADARAFPFGWERSTVYSTEKARTDMEWSPKYHMADGLRMTYEWWTESGLDQHDWDFSAEDRALEMLDSAE